MRRFVLNRKVDATGVSGTGIVAEGVVFEHGRCVMSWLVPPWSMGVYDSITDLIGIHGHDGKTVLEWLD